MELIVRTLADPATYRRLVYLVSALVLGPVWFTALVTVWSLCIGLAITPFVIPVLIVLAFMTRGFAAVGGRAGPFPARRRGARLRSAALDPGAGSGPGSAPSSAAASGAPRPI